MSDSEAQTKRPSYLNAEFIGRAVENKILQQQKQHAGNSEAATQPAFGARVQIQTCDFQKANVVGESFWSAIYRVRVSFSVENSKGANESADKVKSEDGSSSGKNQKQLLQTTFVVKDLIQVALEIGSSEYEMYCKVLPALTRLLQSSASYMNGVADARATTKLAPDCLHCVRDTHETYVLEDLNVLGYRCADRFNGLDMAHARTLLRKTAQFHATSMIYVQKIPEEAATLKPSVFQKSGDDFVFKVLFTCGMEEAAKAAEQWPDFADIITKMRANLQEEMPKRLAYVTRPENCRIRVINHGDLWVNNLLFTYDSKQQPQDAVLLDFQNCFIGNPGFDVNFFLYTSVQLDVLKLHRYELLRYYYEQFKFTLQQCDPTVDVPSWQTMMEEIRDSEVIGYYAVICEFPISCMSKEDAEGLTLDVFDSMEATREKYKFLYKNKRVLDTVRWALDRLNELNVLD